MASVWVIAVKVPGIHGKEEGLYIAVEPKKHPAAVAAKRLVPLSDEPLIISGLLRNSEMALELSHLCDAAFEMGREWGAKHGPTPKKKRLRQNKKK